MLTYTNIFMIRFTHTFLNKPYPADIAYKITNIIKYPNFISAPVHVTVNKLMKDHYLNKQVWRRNE